MSVTESKAKAPVKTSKKSVNPAESAALKAALEAAQVEMVPLSALVKSPLNFRTIPYPADSVREMADSIMAIGLIQNLVVHSLPDGMSGVAAGGRRLAALQQLLSEQPRRHQRNLRDDIAAQEIDPALKAFGRHIARSVRKGRGVHIPAMNNTAFGQVLRTLELKRACN